MSRNRVDCKTRDGLGPDLDKMPAEVFGRIVGDLDKACDLIRQGDPRSDTDIKRLVGNGKFLIDNLELSLVNLMREQDLGEEGYDILRFLGVMQGMLDEALRDRDEAMLAEIARALLTFYLACFAGVDPVAATSELN